jgi:hypothetical protein
MKVEDSANNTIVEANNNYTDKEDKGDANDELEDKPAVKTCVQQALGLSLG